MRLKPGISEGVKGAAQVFHDYAAHHAGSPRHVFRQFCRARPLETQILVERYDATHTGLNYLAARKVTCTVTKVRVALEAAWETDGRWRKWTQCVRRHRLVFGVIVPVLLLPIVLCPTHPLAVYGYLFDMYNPSLTPEAFAATGTDLTAFLRSPTQIRQYRADLLEDMLDTRSSKLFVIVRCPNGELRHEAIRTWNGFLPENLPEFLSGWSDRKELPYLGDKVDTWLRGNEVVAVGHYHAFGGVPSSGDTAAQYFSDLPEIVVVNGVVPMIYLEGNVIPYGGDVVVTEEVFRSLRTLELSLTMDGTRDFAYPTEPSPALRSFLGYLKDYRHVDLSKRDRVAKGIYQLCVEFKEDYRRVFAEGYLLVYYVNNPDKFQFIGNLASLQAWADIYKWSPLDAVEGGTVESGS